MIFAALLFAAIVTDQNDLFTTTADYATFSTNSDGIASQWIPYGTYTDGSGSTEYLRVTSNLIGVVASVFDGCEERNNLPSEYLPEDLGFLRYIYYPTPQITNTITDSGEYLRITNNTLRILDAIDSNSYIFYSKSGSNYTYSVGGTEPIETKLARSETYPDEYHYNSGLSAWFGGRRLDSLVGELGGISPPIGTSWSTDLPFQVSDIGTWALTWPTYSALTNDIHFYPIPSTTTWHRCERPFMDWTNPDHLVEVWGSDVNVAAEDVVTNTLPICLPITLEDVLKNDPGWRYDIPPVETSSWWTVSGPLGNFRLSEFYPQYFAWDNWSSPYPTNYYVEIVFYSNYYTLRFNDVQTGEDAFLQSVSGDENSDTLTFGSYHADRTRFYADTDDFEHWTNKTTRLDWKRLGILCQLERQMETTYLARDDEDYLPFQRTEARRDHIYSGTASVSFLDDHGQFVSVTNIDLAAVQWSLTTQIVESSTSTNSGWCFPTARLEGAFESGMAGTAGTNGSVEVYADPSKFETILRSVASNVITANGLSDGTLQVEISGVFSANGLTGFTWPWVVDMGWFWPNGGGDGTDISSAVSGTESFAATPPQSADLSLVMSLGKRSATMQTDGEAQATTITNFVHYPKTNIWARSWVSEQDRPSLELMLDAKGFEFENYAGAFGPEPMPWDEIKSYTNKVRRVFRMSPFAAAKGNLEQSDLNRWKMLSKLDEEVKDRFEALAGMAIGNAAANLAQFAAGEEAALMAQLTAQKLNVGMFLAVDAPPPPWLVANAIVDVDQNGQISSFALGNIFWAFNEEPYTYDVRKRGSDYIIGSYSFSVSQVSITNQVMTVKPVRVDGHQDQLIKTLWKFKNLRDPTL